MDNPAKNTTQVASNGAEGTQPETRVSDAAGIFAKHARNEDVERKKRGPYKKRGPVGVVEKPEAKRSNPQIDTELIKRTVSSLCGIVDSTFTKKAYRIAKLVGADDNLAKETVASLAMSSDEKEGISQLSADICEKYQVSGAYAHEVLLAVFLTGYSVRVYWGFRSLEAIAREKAVLMKGARLDKGEPLTPT